MENKLIKIYNKVEDSIITIERYIEIVGAQLNELRQDHFSVDNPIIGTYLTVSSFYGISKVNPEDCLKRINYFFEKNENDGNFIRTESLEIALNNVVEFVNQEVSEVQFQISENGISVTTKRRKNLEVITNFLQESERLKNFQRINLESSIITLMTTFENTCRDLLHTKYQQYPNILAEDMISKSYQDLSKYNSIDELLEEVASEKVDSIMYKKVEDILEAVVGKNYVNEFKDDLIEISQRRNIIVHNNGKVNGIYMDKVNPAYNNYSLGDIVELNDNYLMNSAETIFKLLVKALYSLWPNSNSSDKFEFFLNKAYGLMRDTHDRKALYIYRLLMEDLKTQKFNITESDKMVLKINFIQSLKWNDLEAEVTLNLKDFDRSLAQVDHKMCIAFLEDDFVKGADYLTKMIFEAKSRNLPKVELQEYLDDLMTWPILRKFKIDKEEEFESIQDQSEIFEIQV